MDFMTDQLFDGWKIQALTIVNNFSHQCITIHIRLLLKGTDVVAIMDVLRVQLGGVPNRVQADNGSEFILKVLDLLTDEHGLMLDFSRFSKPNYNPYTEAFNESFGD
jgi:putative transposase